MHTNKSTHAHLFVIGETLENLFLDFVRKQAKLLALMALKQRNMYIGV